MRQKIAAGNWKMNKNFEEGVALATALVEGTSASENLMILCTPFIHLKAVHDVIKSTSHIKLAAQNCYPKTSGAYTGEISVGMLKSVGVEYVLVGHSERRAYFSESNAFLAEKINIALEHGLKPIFCCGESLDIREAGTHVEFVANQLKESLFHLSAEQLANVVIAYEPIWAIGTGVTASPEQAQDMHKELRALLATQYDEATADSMTILYGGSVKPASAPTLFACPDVDGGLVGGASLKANDFIAISNSF